MIDGVRYHKDRPASCRQCYFWKNRKVGCTLGKENCYYLAESPKKKNPCERCCYGPCVSFCMKKVLVNRLQMTQEDLTQELNIGYVHMNGIENGRKGCSIDLLLEIAEVLDVSTDYLLTGRLSGGTNTAKNKLKEIAARLNEIVGQLDA